MSDGDIELGPVRRTRRFNNLQAFRPKKEPGQPLSAAEIKYIEALSDGDTSKQIREYCYHMRHVRSLVSQYTSFVPDADIHADFHPAEEPYERLLFLMSEIMEIFRLNSDIAIHRILERLDDKIALVGNRTEDRELKVKHLVFNVIGWVSLLYIPSPNPRSNSFKIALQGAITPSCASASIEKSTRPVDELLRAFGELIPRNVNSKAALEHGHAAPSRLKFKVSYLNAATLGSLANIQIQWVDTVSAHLDFDPSIPALFLFRSPSFCKLQQSDNSMLAILCQNIYVGEEKPIKDFSVGKMLREILLSYSLIFRDDRRARNLYHKTERKRASLEDSASEEAVDPWLDKLCGAALSSSIFSFGGPVREAYDAEADFPIFRRRITKIQDYMESVQPNRFMSLWRDRRDLRIWYTIWTVIVLGLISIVQTTIGIALAAAQLQEAIKANEMQMQQGSQSLVRP